MVLAFGAILDPAKKLNFSKYTYLRLDPRDYEEKLEIVKKTLYAFFKEQKWCINFYDFFIF